MGPATLRPHFLSSLKKGIVGLFLLLTSLSGSLASEEPRMLRSDFDLLISELAPKVDLFRDVWLQDPEAQIGGGASRDFIIWVRSQISGMRTHHELQERIKALKSFSQIQAREFLLPISDADVLSHHRRFSLSSVDYGVKRIDFNQLERFDPKTPAGQDELKQGFLPVEKIRLTRHGVAPDSAFGDGVQEVLDGRLTITFPDPEEFKKTHFAMKGINHEILLVARYLRQESALMGAIEGNRVLSKDEILSRIPARDFEAMKAIVRESENDPDFLKALGKPKFVEFLSGSIQKAFLGRSHRQASRILFRELGFEQLWSRFPKLGAVPQLFIRDPEKTEQFDEKVKRYSRRGVGAIRKFGEIVPDGRLFHGTPYRENLQSILLHGAIPSADDRYVGSGIYSTDQENLDIAMRYSLGNSENMINFSVDHDARVLDLTDRNGEALARRWKLTQGISFTPWILRQKDYDRLAQDLGVDIIRFNFNLGGSAFAVKNQAVLHSPKSWSGTPRGEDELKHAMREVRSEETFVRFVLDYLISDKSQTRGIDLQKISYPPGLSERIEKLRVAAGERKGSYQEFGEKTLMILLALDRLLENSSNQELNVQRQTLLGALKREFSNLPVAQTPEDLIELDQVITSIHSLPLKSDTENRLRESAATWLEDRTRLSAFSGAFKESFRARALAFRTTSFSSPQSWISGASCTALYSNLPWVIVALDKLRPRPKVDEIDPESLKGQIRNYITTFTNKIDFAIIPTSVIYMLSMCFDVPQTAKELVAAYRAKLNAQIPDSSAEPLRKSLNRSSCIQKMVNELHHLNSADGSVARDFH